MPSHEEHAVHVLRLRVLYETGSPNSDDLMRVNQSLTIYNVNTIYKYDTSKHQVILNSCCSYNIDYSVK